MSNSPATRIRKRDASSTRGEHKELVAALVPEVMKGVVTALKAMGVIPNSVSAQQKEAADDTPSTDNQSSLSSDVNQSSNSGTYLQTTSKELSPNVEVKNLSISRPLGLGMDSKIKSKIYANEFVDFSTLLRLKKRLRVLKSRKI